MFHQVFLISILHPRYSLNQEPKSFILANMIKNSKYLNKTNVKVNLRRETSLFLEFMKLCYDKLFRFHSGILSIFLN